MTAPDRPTYPLPRPDDDPRFTFGLVLEVGEVIAAHAYPAPAKSGTDLVRLQQALFTFLYGGTFTQPGEVQP